MRTRAQVFVTGGDAGGSFNIFYCHDVCGVLTRWQCSVGIVHDKFHQKLHHFRNFLSPSCNHHCVCVCLDRTIILPQLLQYGECFCTSPFGG